MRRSFRSTPPSCVAVLSICNRVQSARRQYLLLVSAVSICCTVDRIKRNTALKMASKKTWWDWRRYIKKKAASEKQHMKSTGGGPDSKEVLTDIEERVIKMYGNAIASGEDEVMESRIGPIIVGPPTALAQANNFLSVNIHRLLAADKGNVFFSPFSISTAMAMLLCAAEGETETELRAALGHDHAGTVKGDIATLFDQQISILLKNPGAYTLACANSMLSQKGFEVKDQYKSVLAESFKALLLEVDFQNETQKVITQINDWVKEKTNNMIPKLVDSLDPATIMVIMNAVYFKGSWMQKFDEKDTFPQSFYNNGLEENVKEVQMMHMAEEEFPYAENELFQALQLPYIDEEVAMLILLPRLKDGLESLEASLSPSFVQDLRKNLWKKKVKVSLPRFRLEYSKSLVQSFQELGVARVFRRGAELGGASDSPNLAVSDIIHKAVLEVNEEGSEAAAATMVSIMLCSLSFDPIFVADHPFAFVIFDTRNDLILFMGRVEEL